jgi:hypothetical protein
MLYLNFKGLPDKRGVAPKRLALETIITPMLPKKEPAGSGKRCAVYGIWWSSGRGWEWRSQYR